MSFAEYFRSLLIKKDISLYELSARTGIGSGHLSRLATGKRSAPKPPMLRQIAEAIGVPYEEMLEQAGYLEQKNQYAARIAAALERMDEAQARVLAERIESAADLFPKQAAIKLYQSKRPGRG